VYNHLAAAKIIKDSLAPGTVLIGGGLSALGSRLPVVSEYGIYNGLFDMAGLGRQAFADPSLPAKYTEDRLEEVHWCRCCDKCGELLRSGRQSYCVFI
jgi:2,4-dienoyl-CoA reductase-like NADH-dependent reductase (Old Yellow Enzyme family)